MKKVSNFAHLVCNFLHLVGKVVQVQGKNFPQPHVLVIGGDAERSLGD